VDARGRLAGPVTPAEAWSPVRVPLELACVPVAYQSGVVEIWTPSFFSATFQSWDANGNSAPNVGRTEKLCRRPDADVGAIVLEVM